MSGELRAIVTVSEMARMVGLSRARFYQLMRAGIFPEPIYQGGRPVYTAEMQAVCLEVRKKNLGINGQPVLFYARRPKTTPTRPKTPKPKLEPKQGDVSALVDGLNALGLTIATAAQVEQVTGELFPKGTDGIDQGEVLRAVFLAIRRQNSADNVRR
jgi:Prophage CP4-57 regulatory protein (AlpA)